MEINNQYKQNILNYLSINDIFQLIQINSQWKQIIQTKQQWNFINSLLSKKQLNEEKINKFLQLIQTEIKEIKSSIEFIEDHYEYLSEIESYHLYYKACYLSQLDTECDIRSRISSIISTSNCLTPFNGLLGMLNLEKFSMNISFNSNILSYHHSLKSNKNNSNDEDSSDDNYISYYDSDEESDDSEDPQNELIRYQTFFNAIQQLTTYSLKEIILCCQFDILFILLEMIQLIDCKIIIILDEWNENEEIIHFYNQMKNKSNIHFITYFI